MKGLIEYLGFVFIGTFLLSACMSTPDYSCHDSKPLTKAEKKFFREIENLGLKIKERPDIGYGYRHWFNDEYPCEYSSNYSFWIENVPNLWYDDTVRIKKFVSDLFVDLYSNVLEDSVRCFIDSYEITLISKDKNTLSKKKRWYTAKVSEEKLTNFIGYKIVTDKNGLKKVDVYKYGKLEYLIDDL